MSSNYMFAFRRPVQSQQVADTKGDRSIGVKSAAGAKSMPMNTASRFSLNRLINLKSTGGCRSCN